MAELVCDTSPLQYLHQVGLLGVLPVLATGVLVPPAVAAEIAVGRGQGIDLPDLTAHHWITIRAPLDRFRSPLRSTSAPGSSKCSHWPGKKPAGSRVTIASRFAATDDAI